MAPEQTGSADGGGPARDPRTNRSRLLDAALLAMQREGVKVPMGTVAADAGLGVGTLYRHFATRDALLEELAFRSIQAIAETARQAEASGGEGLRCIDRFITNVVDMRGQILLPLTGGPVYRTERILGTRAEVRRTLQRLIDRGHDDGSIRADATPEDVIMFSAALCQPEQSLPIWGETSQRLRQIFVDGLSGPRAG